MAHNIIHIEPRIIAIVNISKRDENVWILLNWFELETQNERGVRESAGGEADQTWKILIRDSS